MVRQVQGVWRLSFHGSRAPLLPDSSLGGERKESKGKSLNMLISMQGQAMVAAVAVPGLPRARGRGLRLAGAEGRRAAVPGWAAGGVLHRRHIPETPFLLHMSSPASFPPHDINGMWKQRKPLTGTKITHSEITSQVSWWHSAGELQRGEGVGELGSRLDIFSAAS